MNKQYRVFSAAHQPAAVTANLPDGSPVEATIDSLVVQLVPVDGQGGTVQLVITQDLPAAEAVYVPGDTITATFTGAQ